jgi:DNA-damage-inducible protein J
MENVTVQARINPQLKKQVEEILKEIGLSTSDAIRVFLQQCVNSGGLPFQPVVRQPNAETIEAINEAQTGKAEKTNLKNLRKEMGLKPKHD